MWSDAILSKSGEEIGKKEMRCGGIGRIICGGESGIE